MVSLLWLLFVVLLVLWLVGFAVNWGAFVWLLLVAAAVALVLTTIPATPQRKASRLDVRADSLCPLAHRSGFQD
jgi:hypothetical protein